MKNGKSQYLYLIYNSKFPIKNKKFKNVFQLQKNFPRTTKEEIRVD